jgi:hypothetical protein
VRYSEILCKNKQLGAVYELANQINPKPKINDAIVTIDIANYYTSIIAGFVIIWALLTVLS